MDSSGDGHGASKKHGWTLHVTAIGTVPPKGVAAETDRGNFDDYDWRYGCVERLFFDENECGHEPDSRELMEPHEYVGEAKLGKWTGCSCLLLKRKIRCGTSPKYHLRVEMTGKLKQRIKGLERSLEQTFFDFHKCWNYDKRGFMGGINRVFTTMDGETIMSKGVAVGYPSGNGESTQTGQSTKLLNRRNTQN